MAPFKLMHSLDSPMAVDVAMAEYLWEQDKNRVPVANIGQHLVATTAKHAALDALGTSMY